MNGFVASVFRSTSVNSVLDGLFTTSENGDFFTLIGQVPSVGGMTLDLAVDLDAEANEIAFSDTLQQGKRKRFSVRPSAAKDLHGLVLTVNAKNVDSRRKPHGWPGASSSQYAASGCSTCHAASPVYELWISNIALLQKYSFVTEKIG